jgi:hypothetical protein
MKNNIKAYELIEKGLSSKTVSKLDEAQIETLYNKLVLSEQVTEVPTKKTFKVGPKGGKVGNVMVSTDPNTKEVIVTTENELDEDETDDVTSQNALGKDAMQTYTGQEAPHMANDMAPDGMDDDSDNDRKMMGMSEEKKKSKKEKEQNPWAICTAQLGKEFGTRERHLWSAKEKNKYERCVKDVKKSLKEGKNPVSLFLENEIMRIVEKNLPPRITKGDLMKYLSEAGPATAPTKPAPGTKPTTKPGKPDTRPRPKHPGKNPNPGENPAPKAKKVSPEVAKDEVLDLIMNLLEK